MTSSGDRTDHSDASDVLDRRRRAAIAGHRGDLDLARELAKDPDPNVRATALGALARIGALTVDELIGASLDSSPIVRRRACTEAARWPEPPSPDDVLLTAITSLLDDPDDSVVEIAAWSLGERPPVPASTVARLCEIATGHDEPLCRESAVAALGAIGDPLGLPAILSATTDRATVRRRAVLALAPFDGDEVDAALARALEDRDWQVRQAAEDLGAEPIR